MKSYFCLCSQNIQSKIGKHGLAIGCLADLPPIGRKYKHTICLQCFNGFRVEHVYSLIYKSKHKTYYENFMMKTRSNTGENVPSNIIISGKVQCRAACWTTSNFDYLLIVTAIVKKHGLRTLELRLAFACL